jgi:hypothetical protein
MFKQLLIISFLFVIGCSSADKKNGSAELTVFQSGTLYGYKNSGGKVVIPAEYMRAEAFQNQIAFVADRQKWMIIDTKGKIIPITPFLIEENNMPDAFSNGLARLEKDGKIGYYDNTGRVVIAPQFAFGYPFEGGKAKVCTDCKKETKKNKTEYVGKFFFIDTTGNPSDGTKKSTEGSESKPADTGKNKSGSEGGNTPEIKGN